MSRFVTRQYDATGAWSQLTGSAGNVLWQGGNADAEARWLNWTLGNGLVTTTTFGGNTGRLSSLTTNGAVQGLTLAYDGFGNIKSRLDAANGYRQSNGTAETFVYDNLNQLTQANFLEGPQNISYDGFGRILTKTGVNAVAGGYSYYTPSVNGGGQSNRVLTANGRTYTYDANGNADTITGTAAGTITLSWTSFNQALTLPVAAGQGNTASAGANPNCYGQAVICLRYGADNARVLEYLPPDASQSGAGQGTSRFVLHSGASLFFEEDLKADGTSEARAYLTGPLGVVAVHTTPSSGSPSLTYWHRDHLGSLTVTTDENGAVKERMRFDPWGKPMTPLGARSGSGDRGFTGHEHLAGGLIHMNGRIYDPVLGRFLSADIVVQMPSAITSYNRYGYVMNNPLSMTDPSGYFFVIDDMLIAFLIANGATATVATVSAYAAIGSAVGGTIAAATGHTTAARRFFAAAIAFATAGTTAYAGIGAFAAGGVQSGSLEGAVIAGVTAGAGLALAPVMASIVTGLESAINSAFASATYEQTIAGYIPNAQYASAGGVSDVTVVDKVEVSARKPINWATDVAWTATPQGRAAVGAIAGHGVAALWTGVGGCRRCYVAKPAMPQSVPKNLTGYANPHQIRYMQDSLKGSVRNYETGEVTANKDMVDALRSNKLSPGDIDPIRVWVNPRNGEIYSLDHNRLWIAKEANVPIKIVPASAQELAAEFGKMNTKVDGVSINVRNQ